MPLLSALEKWPRWSLTTIGLVLIYLCGWIDYLTGIELSPQVLYLIPVGIVAWCVGRGPGCLLALNTAMARLIADQLTMRGLSLEIVPLANAAGHGAVAVMFAWTLAALRVRLDREASLSRTDALTKVNNFRAFIERADHEIDRARRRGHQFAVVYLDCDNFKQVNDRFGHVTGDELLCLIADTLQNGLRRFDIVARLGGDEFALLLPEVTAEQTAMITKRVQEKLSAAVNTYRWPVTFSVGAVTFQEAPQSVPEVLRIADEVMYCAKKSGKNQICFQTYNCPVSPQVVIPSPQPPHQVSA